MRSYREILKLQLLGHSETASSLIDEMPDDMDGSELIAAAFSVLVAKRFEDNASANAVRHFVDEARQNYADADPSFKPLAAEALIRTVLDPDKDAGLLDEVDPNDQVVTELLVARKIVAESVELTERIDEVLEDAVQIEKIWAES